MTLTIWIIVDSIIEILEIDAYPDYVEQVHLIDF